MRRRPLKRAVRNLLALHSIEYTHSGEGKFGGREVSYYTLRPGSRTGQRLRETIFIDHLDSVEVIQWALDTWEQGGVLNWKHAPYKEKWRMEALGSMRELL